MEGFRPWLWLLPWPTLCPVLPESTEVVQHAAMQRCSLLRCVLPWHLGYGGNELFAFVCVLNLKRPTVHSQVWGVGPMSAQLPSDRLALRAYWYLAPNCGPEVLAVWLDDLLSRFNCDHWAERGRRNGIFLKKVGTEMKLEVIERISTSKSVCPQSSLVQTSYNSHLK